MLKATHNRNGYDKNMGRKTKRHFIGEYSGNGVAELKSDLGKFDFNRIKDYVGLGMSGGGMEDGLIPPEYYTKFATQSNQHMQSEGSGMSGGRCSKCGCKDCGVCTETKCGCDSDCDTEGGSKKSQYLQHLLYKDQFDIQRPQEQYRPNLEKRDRYRREQPIAPMPMMEESIAAAAQVHRPVDEPLVPSLSRARSLERIRARAASERPQLNETQFTGQQEYRFESKPEPSYVLKEQPRPPPSFKSETKTASEEAVSKPRKKKTIESIQGISNMQPVLDFLDRDDAIQLAKTSKAMNAAVDANKASIPKRHIATRPEELEIGDPVQIVFQHDYRSGVFQGSDSRVKVKAPKKSTPFFITKISPDKTRFVAEVKEPKEGFSAVVEFVLKRGDITKSYYPNSFELDLAGSPDDDNYNTYVLQPLSFIQKNKGTTISYTPRSGAAEVTMTNEKIHNKKGEYFNDAAIRSYGILSGKRFEEPYLQRGEDARFSYYPLCISIGKNKEWPAVPPPPKKAKKAKTKAIDPHGVD